MINDGGDGGNDEGASDDHSANRFALDATPFVQDVARLMQEMEALVRATLDRDSGTEDRIEAVAAIDDWAMRSPYGLDLRPMLIEVLQQVCRKVQCPRLWEQLADARLARAGATLKWSAGLCGLPALEWVNTEAPAMGLLLGEVPSKSRACDAWQEAVDWIASRDHDNRLDGIHVYDLVSTIRMLKLLVLFSSENDWLNTPQARLRYLENVGLPLWDSLLPRIEYVLPTGEDHERELGEPARLHLLDTLRECCREVEKTPPVLGVPHKEGRVVGSRLPTPTPMHVVVRGPIPPATYREDKEGLKMYSTLQHPLPVAGLPDINELDRIIESLRREFPWAITAIEEVGRDLRARKLFGGIEMGMTPMLVVGPPGCGKSRLGRRIGEEFTLPLQLLALGGSNDTKLITGTARGWGGGQPAPLLTLMAQRQCASAFVVLDEVDKAAPYGNEGKPLTSTLLALLEPESACRWHDGFLQAQCDLSKVMYWATANLLSPIAKPLLSRLRVVYMPEPRPEHFGAIAEGVACDIAAEWGLHRDVLPQVGHLIELAGARNVREVRALVKRRFQDFAEANLRRDRLH